MRNILSRNLSNIIQRNSSLTGIAKQCADIHSSAAHVHSLLPQHIQDQVIVANVYSDRITLLVENAAIATQLRFSQQQWLQYINSKRRITIQKVEIKIQPQKVFPKVSQSDPAFLSKNARKTLVDAANSITDPELADALKRLAKVHQS